MLSRPSTSELAEAVGLQIEPEHDTYDVVIIGGGPTGLAAAVYGASEGLRTLLVEREATGGQAGTSSRIENYLGFPSGVSGDDLAAKAREQALRLGAEIVVTRSISTITPRDDCHTVTLDGGRVLGARAVILATGVAYRALEARGHRGVRGHRLLLRRRAHRGCRDARPRRDPRRRRQLGGPGGDVLLGLRAHA